MAKVIVFDVNGTLLDLSVLDSPFDRLLSQTGTSTAPNGASGHPGRQMWFSTLERLWLTGIATGTYLPFDQLALAALRMITAQWNLTLPVREESAIDKLKHAVTDALGMHSPTPDEAPIMDQLKDLPPFPDAAPGLAQLQEAGFRLAALTNGAQSSAERMLEQGGLKRYLDEVISVDDIKRHKPARQAYELASTRLKVPLSALWVAAAHDWDIAGANAVECSTAFVQRPGKVLNPLGPKPTLQATNLIDLADKLIREPLP